MIILVDTSKPNNTDAARKDNLAAGLKDLVRRVGTATRPGNAPVHVVGPCQGHPAAPECCVSWTARGAGTAIRPGIAPVHMVVYPAGTEYCVGWASHATCHPPLTLVPVPQDEFRSCIPNAGVRQHLHAHGPAGEGGHPHAGAELRDHPRHPGNPTGRFGHMPF